MEKVKEGQAAPEVLTLADMAEAEFLRLYQLYDVAHVPEKRRADLIDSFWPDIYKAVFKAGPEDIRYNNTKSKLKTYDVQEVEEVTERFIMLNKRYGGVIKYNQFSNMTGVSKYTLYLWHKANKTNGYIFSLNSNDIEEENNCIYYVYKNGVLKNYRGNGYVVSDVLSSFRFDVIKKLQEEMQDSNTNGLSNDTMGHALRANNEDELGKLYEPRRMIQHEQIRQAITADSLPVLHKITQKDTQPQDIVPPPVDNTT